MKINHNLSAVIANNRLKTNEDMVARSMERLSSGLKINHAKDNPAGMAISNKMQTQINGLDRASQNSSDAQSLVETADGVLDEINSMVQRIRELAVQAASDTNTLDDKEQLQLEVEQLKKEINRMSEDTEYNTRSLLDGSFDNRVYSSKTMNDKFGVPQPDLDRVYVTDEVEAGIYRMDVLPGSKASIQGQTGSPLFDNSNGVVSSNQAGTVSINGFRVDIEVGDTYEAVLKKFQYGAEKGEATLDISNKTLDFTAARAGNNAPLLIDLSPQMEDFLKIAVPKDGDHNCIPTFGKDVTFYGMSYNDDAVPPTYLRDVTTMTDGDKVIVQRPNGFQMSFTVSEDLVNSSNPNNPVSVSLEVTTMGSIQAQVGANEDQTMHLRLPKINTEMLYMDDLDLTTVTGADRGIATCDYAIDRINSLRAKIGAYDNRLEHTIHALDQESENMTSALSRIRDADMAKEMTEYTSGNVLVQAATSVLSQANDQPESVLQLLQ